MERGALQLAKCAVRSGWDARIILYDLPFTRSDNEYDPGNIPVTFVARRDGIDMTLPSRLANIFRHWAVDIVHARNNVASIYSAAAIAVMGQRRPPLVVTFDTFPGSGTIKARFASRWAARQAAKVTSVSGDLSERLVGSGWVPSADTIWNGVDDQEFRAEGPGYGLKGSSGLEDPTILLGNVARLDENKRQVDLIQAFQLAQSNSSGIALVLAGDGPSRSEIECRLLSVQNAKLIPRVHDVAAFLRELDIFVLCSVDEGAPRALLEAMMCAKAIITTAVGGVPHILGDSGILVPPKRPDLLAASIQRLSASRSLRERLGAAARQRALHLFSMDREWQQYADIYDSLLRSPSTGAPT
jgi:glycosyltransferase involved in cell wall biosynthesis